MEQTNLYEALNISQSLTVEEIQSALVQLERVWHQREINQPEKAHKMLALIDEARVAFKTEQSKADYDKSLDTANREVDNQPDNSGKIAQWKSAADEYFLKKQYDLAEAALEKAFAYPECAEDESLYILAGNIFHNSGKYDRAIDCINNALLINQDNWQSYALKGITYVDIGRYKQQGIYHGILSADDKQMFEEALRIYDLGIAAARKEGNTYGEGFIQGHKAFLLYNTQGKEAALNSLNEAQRLGDPSGQGKVIADAIEQTRQREYQYSIEYYPCAPIETEEPMNGLFYTKHTFILDEVESALIYVFLGRDVKMTYDSYDIRHQFGGHDIEDREECWYEWNVPNEGKVNFRLMEHAPENFNDGGYTKLIMSYTGSNSGFPQIKEKMNQVLARLNNKGITVYTAPEIKSMKETRIVKYRKQIGRCQYCGNVFKGLMTKKCCNCGRVKDY